MRFPCMWASLLLLSPAAVRGQESVGAGPGSDPLTFVHQGTQDNAKGDYAGALDAFTHALELNAQDPAALEGLGETHLAQGDLSDAVDNFTKALAIAPNEEPTLYHRAVAETKLGDFASALADADHALQAGTLPPGALRGIYLERGLTKLCQGDDAGAVADANQALMVQPPAPEALFLRGMAENAEGNVAAAADDFAQSAKGGMPEAALWFWLAKMEAHDSSGAASQLPALLTKAEHGHPHAWLDELANLLQEKTTSQQIVADLPSASTDPVKAEQGWFFLGVAREFSGDTAGALDAYRHVHTIGTSDSFRVIESQRRAKLLSS